ncbi:MAG TPA: GNAT family N-acetyltransferase, partial [Candidatus Acidoferrales bacterium]|nr:GNAT family N-acetyltransferase [Candidatus Acidoferrales bacterium]
ARFELDLPNTWGLKTLTTKRLHLRGWRPEDEAPFAAINADPEVARYLRGRPETAEETAALLERIRQHWQKWGYGLWAVERIADLRFIGFVGFSHHGWFQDRVELGWRLSRECWGHGLATEGAQAALAYGLETLGLEQIISVIHRDNAASRRVAEKIGMHLEREAQHEDLPIVVYLRRA